MKCVRHNKTVDDGYLCPDCYFEGFRSSPKSACSSATGCPGNADQGAVGIKCLCGDKFSSREAFDDHWMDCPAVSRVQPTKEALSELQGRLTRFIGREHERRENLPDQTLYDQVKREERIRTARKIRGWVKAIRKLL